MLLYHSPSFNPHFNLALEEFLFEEHSEDFLLIYRNDDSVICGKHQNAVAEHNASFLHDEKIPLIRRFSGGGTVYHDRNNINFSFITSGENTRVIDFKKYAIPVIEFLKGQGIDAELSERHDILLNGKKISGHAAHSKNKRAIHHGTLLFDADLSRLSNALRSDKDKFQSRAVKSVRSKVTNLSLESKNLLSIESFIDKLIFHLNKVFDVTSTLTLTEKENESIQQLAETKYSDWNWNYAYGPDYSFKTNEELNGENVEFEVEVKKGVISSLTFIESPTFEDGIKKIIGQRHYWPEIKEILEKEFGVELGLHITKQLF